MFNIICIQQVCDDPFLNQQCFILFKSDFDKKFKVKEVLDSDMCNKYFMWLIKWMDSNEFTWHQFSDLTGCDKALKHFYNYYSNKSDKIHWCEQLAHLKNIEFLS